MKKEHLIKLFILIISLAGFVFFTSGMDFGRSERYENLLVERETFDTLISERNEELDSEHPDIYFDDFSLTYDTLSNTYFYSIIEDSPSRHNPLVRTVSTRFNRYDVAILGDILNDSSIENNEQAEILFYTDDSYKIYSIAATTLPIVTINMNEQISDRDNPIGDLDEPATFTLFDNRSDVSSSDRHITSHTYARLRGASSRRFTKNQFRLNLREISIAGTESNNHLSLLGMREDDDWILYSPYNDPEKMRNTLSNNLWYESFATNNSLDIVNGTQGTFVEVFVDNMYWGIYTLMHPIDRKQLELDVNSRSLTSDFYYRAVTNIAFDIEDFIHPGEQYIRGRFELRDPEPNGMPEQWDPLVDHLLMIDEDEETLIEYISTQTDIDNLIDYYLFYILTQATDNNTKNRNYIAYYNDGEHFMLESPWDLDLTWGLRWAPGTPRLSLVTGLPDENFSPSVSHITRLIEMNNEQIKQQVHERYRQLRASEWSDQAFDDRISNYESMIFKSGAAKRDYSRWPSSAYEKDADKFRAFVNERLNAMDIYLNDILGGD
ncbi:hypothetical protein IRB23SM22_08430 [Alkalibacterium sp. s-m-22]